MSRKPYGQMEDRFRLRPRPPRNRGGAHGARFITRVLTATNRAASGNSKPFGALATGRGAKLGRGHVAARFAGAGLDSRSRRVIIKARLVVLKHAGPRNLSKHLRYIERDGVSRQGARGVAYGPQADVADTGAFEARCRNDRHQFRFIVAPEDAIELDELRPYTLALMQRMEGDLGSRLDWIAVDHWDTDNPHTHIVLRGVDETSQNLVIAREYISHGMRRRAAELATEWLGPRTEREIRAGLEREVAQMRWTSLDRALADLARDGAIDLHQLRSDQGMPRQIGLLVGRLQHLETMGLATTTEPGRWRLRRDVESVLRAQGELGDIVRTMQRALGRERREHRVFDPARASEALVGRIAGKGLADELRDRGYLIVDGVDGKGHYVRLPASGDVSDWPIGGIVEVTPTVARKADSSIARFAVEGVYRPDHHLAALRSVVSTVHHADETVAAHVRRLETLRRAGIVERLSQGVWRVPADIVKRGHEYDVGRLGGAEIQLRSHLPIDGQVHAGGATWLDRQLAGEIKLALSDQGFGPYVRSALRAREDVLLERGLAERRGQQTVPVRALVSRLSAAEINATAQTIAIETGLHYRPAADNTPVSGLCQRSLQLASGRFVMLDNAMGFTLVPWRPVLEKRMGQSVTALIHGDHVTFQFGRQLGR